MKKNTVLLCLIILLAAFLRLYHLGTNPPSLTWDETAWGYNAYSLGIDGRDEFGRFLPHDYLESFGDFKPPMYAYLDVLPVKIFGLNEFATRLPSAFFGILSVLATYFLVRAIFDKESQNIALLSSFFLAISPWHINLSRAAFEANVATFFIISGIWLFFEWIKGKDRYLPLSVISFTLSIYTFNTARIVSPLLLLVLCMVFAKKILQRKKIFILSVILGFILIIPTLLFLFSPQANLRFREVNIFSDPTVVIASNQEIANDHNNFFSKITHNRRLEYGISFVKHYLDNLNPSFLFIKGDGNPKFSTQDVGQMYLWDLPFFILGSFILFRQKKGHWWVIPVWLILGIVPAATARETPHALRIETILPTFQVITAIGFIYLLSGFKEKTLFFVKTLAFFVLFLNVIYYLHGYYVHYPRTYSGEWQYGYKDSISYVASVEKNYDRVNITDQLGRPYVYYLFYMRKDPEWFRKNTDVTRDAFGFVSVNRVGKYYFSKNPNDNNYKGKILFINSAKDVPTDAKILKNFDLLNGGHVLSAYTL